MPKFEPKKSGRLNLKFTQEKSTRSRSDKQERRLAERFGGHKSINSGATFSQNDVFTAKEEIEAKTTRMKSYSLSVKELEKLRERTDPGKIPVFVIEFEEHALEIACIDIDTYKDLRDGNFKTD